MLFQNNRKTELRETKIGDSSDDEEEEKVDTSVPKDAHIIDDAASDSSSGEFPVPEEAKADLLQNMGKNDRSSGEQSFADEERESNMKKMLCELLQRAGTDEDRRYSTIDDNRLTAKLPSLEESKSQTASTIHEGLGIDKNNKTYDIVKNFCKNLRKRVKPYISKRWVIREMVTTEQTYSKGLNILTKWKEELKNSNLITDDDITDLFSTVVDNIKSISDMFLSDLQKRYDSWTRDSDIGDVYQSFAPYFSIYEGYCKNNELSGK